MFRNRRVCKCSETVFLLCSKNSHQISLSFMLYFFSSSVDDFNMERQIGDITEMKLKANKRTVADIAKSKSITITSDARFRG